MSVRFCIITPSFNQCDFLKQTASTVLEQAGPFDVSWLIVDGGSTDGTVEFLRSIPDPRLRWTSEPDGGQADAVNKGLRQAQADVIGWINSDDLYTPGTFAAVAAAFDRHPQAGWLLGQSDIVDERGSEIRRGITRYKNRGLARYSYRRLLRENFISQPAVFWRKSFGQEVGLLDPSLHHAMDYDLWLRMGRRGDPIILNQLLTHFRIHAGSKTGTCIRERFREDLAVAGRHVGNDRLSWCVHRANVEKIVWAYRAMRLLRR